LWGRGKEQRGTERRVGEEERRAVAASAASRVSGLHVLGEWEPSLGIIIQWSEIRKASVGR